MSKQIDIEKVALEILKPYAIREQELDTEKFPWDEIDEITAIVTDYILNHGDDGNIVDGKISDEIPGNPLGTYKSISSKGTLTLYVKNLSDFFWGILKKLSEQGKLHPVIPVIEKQELIKLAKFTVVKTYQHEIFHYRSDIASILFGSRPDRLEEEALAVAFGHRHACQVLGCDPENPLDNKLYESFREQAFSYTAAGYRDWEKYRRLEDFCNKISKHLFDPRSMRLIKSAGGDTDGWMSGSLYSLITDLPLDMMDEQTQ